MGEHNLIGRTVLVYNRHRNAGGDDANQPEAGIIVRVHDERTVNIGGFDKFGMPFSMHSVQFAPSIQTPVRANEAYARLVGTLEGEGQQSSTRGYGTERDQQGSGRSYVE
jgi:hypothetical protein